MHTNTLQAAAIAAGLTTRAYLTWGSAAEVRRWVGSRLRAFRSHLDSSPAGALPELTNAEGAWCKDSCVSQAWSAATALDALWDAAVLEACLTEQQQQQEEADCTSAV